MVPASITSPLLDAAISENAPEESESNKSNPTRAPDFRGVRITAADYQLEEMIPSMFESLGEKVEIDLVNGENGDSKVGEEQSTSMNSAEAQRVRYGRYRSPQRGEDLSSSRVESTMDTPLKIVHATEAAASLETLKHIENWRQRHHL